MVKAPGTAPKARRGHPEEDHQRAVVEYLHLLKARKWLIFWHAANERGGKCRVCGEPYGAVKRGVLSAMGVVKGTSDLMILFKGGQLAALELKAGRNTPDDDQSKFLNEVRAMGGWGDWSADFGHSLHIINEWVIAATGERPPRV